MNIQEMCTGEAALVPGGLRGYRMWGERGAVLTSVSHQIDWTVPEHSASCHRNSHFTLWLGQRPITENVPAPHVIPSDQCTCGVYGWYRPDEARLHQGDVFGVVEATGRVLLGDFGFRAERARIVALVSEYEPIQHYWTHRGVPVFESRERLLAEFPPQDVRELIGHDIPDTPPEEEHWLWQNVNLTFTANTQYYTTVAQQLSASLNRMSGASKRVSQIMQEAMVQLPEDPKERALALSRQGTRGPVKVRRGRARLSLD